jgi:hypothetical protein
MRERVSLDTSGKFVYSNDDTGPQQARVLIGRDQVVIAPSTQQVIRIDVSQIFDITVGTPPSDLKVAFEKIVTIAYEQADARETITVEPSTVSSRECANTIVREILAGVDVHVRYSIEGSDKTDHPDTKTGSLFVTDDELQIDTKSERISIALQAIRAYRKRRKTIQETTWPIVEVHHRNGDQLQATQLAMRRGANQQLLGRYIESKNSKEKS